VEIDGFSQIIEVIGLAKMLHGMGRSDIVKTRFNDVLSWDTCMESMWEAITSIFSGFHNEYDEGDETEKFIFTDDVISRYFIHAFEHGKKTRTPPDKNQYVIEAQHEARSCFDFTCNMGWNLFGYTKSRRAARKSKLIIYTSPSEFCEHDYLAYGLVHLYKWFKDKCDSFGSEEVKTE